MSTEEEDQIIGRLVRESKESKRTIALIETKIKDMSNRISQAATVFNDYYKEVVSVVR
jgi:hypothetical protein